MRGEDASWRVSFFLHGLFVDGYDAVFVDEGVHNFEKYSRVEVDNFDKDISYDNICVFRNGEIFEKRVMTETVTCKAQTGFVCRMRKDINSLSFFKEISEETKS